MFCIVKYVVEPFVGPYGGSAVYQVFEVEVEHLIYIFAKLPCARTKEASSNT